MDTNLSPAQQRAVANGIQAHSVGGQYPWHPVGIGIEGRWVARNLQTGQRVLWRHNRVEATFSSAGEVMDIIDKVLSGTSLANMMVAGLPRPPAD